MEQANWLLTIHSDANPQVYRTIVNDFNCANSNSKKKFSVEFSTLLMYRLFNYFAPLFQTLVKTGGCNQLVSHAFNVE